MLQVKQQVQFHSYCSWREPDVSAPFVYYDSGGVPDVTKVCPIREYLQCSKHCIPNIRIYKLQCIPKTQLWYLLVPEVKNE